MNFRKNFDDKRWIPYTLAACAAVLLYICLIKINVIFSAVGSFLGHLSPIVSGIVLAYLINPLVNFLEAKVFRAVKKEKIRRMLSDISAYLIVIVFLILLLSFLIPQLIDSVILFINNLNNYSEAMFELIDRIVEKGESMNMDMSMLDQISTNLLSNSVDFVSENSGIIARSSLHLGNNTFNLMLGCILAVYFLASKKLIIQSWHRLLHCILSPERYTQVNGFLSECNRIMSRYVISDIVDAIIVAVINGIFMMLMSMPYGVMISAVVGVTNLIPTFGPFVGAFIGALILLFVDPVSVIIFLIFTLILQLIDGYVIKPKLFGGVLGVPGVWITLGIIAGGKLFGIVGVALSVPVVAILNFIIQDLIIKREAQLKAEAEAAEEDQKREH